MVGWMRLKPAAWAKARLCLFQHIPSMRAALSEDLEEKEAWSATPSFHRSQLLFYLHLGFLAEANIRGGGHCLSWDRPDSGEVSALPASQGADSSCSVWSSQGVGATWVARLPVTVTFSIFRVYHTDRPW